MAEKTRTDEPPHIELQGLHMTFGKQKVLRAINLAIPRGQTVAIIGESGCGKTVFLKTTIGLAPPTRGKVLFDEQDLSTLDSRERSESRAKSCGSIAKRWVPQKQ